MKTPSPQIVSVRSVVCVETFFPSCWTIIETDGSLLTRRITLRLWKVRQMGKETAKKARFHHQVRRPRRESRKCLWGALRLLAHGGSMAPSLDTLFSRSTSSSLCVLSTQHDHVIFTECSFSLLHSLSTLPALQRLSAL